MKVDRVKVTNTAKEWIEKLKRMHGPLLFHQSGGCCDGSAPMCYPRHEFKISHADIHLGTIVDTPVYISAAQFTLWQHTQLIIDVVPGRGSGFSIEAPEGIRFLTRSRVFTSDELKYLQVSDRK